MKTNSRKLARTRSILAVVPILLMSVAGDTLAATDGVLYRGGLFVDLPGKTSSVVLAGGTQETITEARKRKVSASGATGQLPSTPTVASPANDHSNGQSSDAQTQTGVVEQGQSAANTSRTSRRRRSKATLPENSANTPEPLINPAQPRSVWSPPAHITAPTSPTVQVAAPDFWTRTRIRGLFARAKTHLLLTLSVIAGFLAAPAFFLVRSKAKTRASQKQTSRTAEKIGPVQEASPDFEVLPAIESEGRAESPALPTTTQAVDTARQQAQPDEEALQKVNEQLARRRLEVSEARRKADEEIRSLAETAARIRADEDARHQLEEELDSLKEEARKRLQEERARHEETRRLVLEEQQRVQAELGQLFAEEEQRLAALEAEKKRANEELRRRAEQERRIRAEIDELYRAGAEQRARIEVETQRRAEAEARLRQEQDSLLAAGFQQSALGSDEATSVLVDDSLTDPDTSDSKETNTPPGVLKGIDSLVAEERAAAVREIALLGGEDAFCFITKAFDDQSAVVRNAAARALYDFDADRAASYMRALREATAERRRMIAESIVSSGLAGEAIVKLTAESRQEACDAFSVLFLMARVGELQPLLAAIEEHPDVDTRLAAIRLLALTRRTEILPPFRSLSMQPSIPAEIKSALTEAIYHISGQSQDTASLMA